MAKTTGKHFKELARAVAEDEANGRKWTIVIRSDRTVLKKFQWRDDNGRLERGTFHSIGKLKADVDLAEAQRKAIEIAQRYGPVKP